MFRKSLLVGCILCAAILIGCSTTETSNSNTAAGNSNKGTASSNTGGSSTTAATGDKIGVPECDDYIAKYEACVTGKVPEAARAQYQASLKTLRDSWRQAAANPQTKAALAQGCKQALDSAQASMKSFGCTW